MDHSFNCGPHGRYEPLPSHISTVPGWMEGETFRFLQNYDDYYSEDFYDIVKSYQRDGEIYYLYHRPKLDPKLWNQWSEYYKVYHLDRDGNQRHLGFYYVGQNWDSEEAIEGVWVADYNAPECLILPTEEATYRFFHDNYMKARVAVG
jgi:hypothetical protein